MTTQVLLYTTAGCHLCEQAEQLLMEVLPQFPAFDWQALEISNDLRLVDAYGLRIPVIGLPNASEELGWPFDAAALAAYLSRHQR
jgi:glutaredoxin